MKIKEIRQHEKDQILHELAEQQKHLYALRTQSVTEKLEDPSQLKKARKTIARIKTVLRQRGVEAAKGKQQSDAAPKEAVSAK
jgi:large subunit ribosomal protein L29